jgi:hypothetical protein
LYLCLINQKTYPSKTTYFRRHLKQAC